MVESTLIPQGSTGGGKKNWPQAPTKDDRREKALATHLAMTVYNPQVILQVEEHCEKTIMHIRVSKLQESVYVLPELN